MATYFPAKRATAYRDYVHLQSAVDPLSFQANPTLAAGDVKVSKDGGAFANLATLPAVTPAAGRAVQVDLSSTEMTADLVVVQFVDQTSPKEWADFAMVIATTARQIDDLAYPATSGRSIVVDAAGLVDANTVKLGPSGSGTAQSARDIGASVLLSSGTGTGQLKLASGYVAMTWADIAAPTTSVNLSGTTIATTQKVDVDTIKTNPVVNGGTITFPAGATLASTTNITAGTITTVTNLTNAPTSGDFTATMKTSVTTAATAATPTAAAVTGNVGGNVTGSVGSVVGLTASNLDATISSRLASASYTAPLSAAGTRTAIGLASANLDTQLAALPTVSSILTTQMTESYASDGAAPTLAQALFLIQQQLGDFSISGTTLTVKKLDGSTTAATFTLDSSSSPTALARTG